MIKVTASNIANASPLRLYTWDENPVALAMRDAGLPRPNANWALKALTFHDGTRGTWIGMPQEVWEWLIKWANYEEVFPFEFDLPVEFVEKEAA